MTDRPAEPTPGPEASDLTEGEPTAAPSPEGAPSGGFGDSAGEMANETEVEADVPPRQGDVPDAGTGAGPDDDTDTEVDELAAMKGSLADLTNDLQRLSAEYANYRKRVDRDRQLTSENATFRVLAPIIEVLDTIDRAREHEELEGGFKAVADQLTGVVTNLGLTRFGEPGDPFDPTLHEALSHLGTDPEVSVVTCKHIAKAGYKIGDRVVRAAQVLVVDPVEG